MTRNFLESQFLKRIRGYREMVKQRIIDVILFILDLPKLFFGAESGKEVVKKGGASATGFGLFYATEYFLMGVTISFVTYLHYLNIGYWVIFLIVWPGTVLFQWLVVKSNDKSAVDFTLCEGQSRVVFALGGKIWKLHIIWRIVLSPIIISIGSIWLGWQIFWNGAGPMVIFLKQKKCFDRQWLIWMILIIVSGIQMSVWVKVYLLGYDSLTDLYFYLTK
jgi:hypothetical protein